jgi:hypothetical protein
METSMYGSNAIMPRGRILSYEDAVERYDGTKPIRGRSTDIRPLGRRSNDQFTINRHNDDSIAVRLYHTDIIIYRPDGTIELEPYSSRLTNDYVRHILSGGVTPNYNSQAGRVLWVKHKGYLIPRCAVLSPDFDLISGSEPFIKYSLNRKRSNKALHDSGFNQFSLWLRTQIRLGLDPRQGHRWVTDTLTDSSVRCLDMPEYYSLIVRDLNAFRNVDDQLKDLRFAVLKYYDCIDATEMPFVNDWKELASVVSSKRRYE